MELRREVQCRFPAQVRQHRIGAHLGNDLFQVFHREWLHIGHIGHTRIGHDGGGIGINENHLVAELAQSLAGLGARVVKFAGLANDNGA